MCHITAIAATALTLDNLPTGWAAEASSGGITLRLWFGDTLKVGTTQKSFTVEKVLLGQATPAYIAYRGMVVNSLNLTAEAGAILTGSIDLMGKAASVGTSALDASPAAPPANPVLNAVNNVGRIAENGVVAAGPNFVRSVSVSLANNLREQNAIGTLGPVGLGTGDADITGNMTTYFGSKDLYERYLTDAETAFNFRVGKEGQAYVFTVPRMKFESGQVVAGGRNQDVMAEMGWRALRDGATATSFQIDRVWQYA